MNEASRRETLWLSDVVALGGAIPDQEQPLQEYDLVVQKA